MTRPKHGLLTLAIAACAMALPCPVPASAAPKTSRFGACVRVNAQWASRVVEGMKSDVGPVTIRRSGAVRSPDFQKVWFIAIRFDAVGAPGSVGVWATNGDPASARSTGIVMSVDAFAQAFTDWPRADKSDARISKTDPGAAAAKACLGR